MVILIGIPLMVILAVLQSVIVNDLTLLDGRPDLVLLAVVAWGIGVRPRDSMVWALIGGLSLDLLSDLPFGVTAINLVLIAYLISFSEGRFWESHILMPMAVTLLASLLFHMLSLIIVWLLGKQIDLGMAVIRVVLPSTFLNIVLALPATQLAKSLGQRIYPPEVKI
jgi:rod shape-determining protein MreD